MIAWILPDNIADLLPAQMRELERMRRVCLDLFASHGFEAVEPPLIEYVASLLTGSGSDLDSNTFKFMDQSNGRMVGLRADITPQIARIDAHILNRSGVSRLCYAASCLHARALHPLASRQPFVAGAELFGHSGVDADVYMLALATRTLRALGIAEVRVDIGHMGIVRALLSGCGLPDETRRALMRALATRDPVALAASSSDLPSATRAALAALLEEYGDETAIERLRRRLPDDPAISRALSEVTTMAHRSGADEVSFDFCDVHGYRYLTGATFSAHVDRQAAAALRGGRYDDIGSAFGRSRPACGFTVYLRELATAATRSGEDDRPAAVLADAGEQSADYRRYVDHLRRQGHVVVSLLPGEKPSEVAERFKITHRLERSSDGLRLTEFTAE